ncbi:hypothetical protein GGF32_000793 [Allomyces javanicus]|nr:hypothetical protein GGF32_000793 [Allomyces javanicus]
MSPVPPAPSPHAQLAKVLRVLLAHHLGKWIKRPSHGNDGDEDASVLVDVTNHLADECLNYAGQTGVPESTLFAVVHPVLCDWDVISPDDTAAQLAVQLFADDLAEALPDLGAFLAVHGDPDAGSDDEDDGEEEGEPGTCELCARGPMRLSFHHLIPKKVHKKMFKRGLYSKEEMHTRGAMLCRQCHSAVHRFFDHETLATQYATVAALLGAEEVQRWVAFQSKQKIRQRALR